MNGFLQNAREQFAENGVGIAASEDFFEGEIERHVHTYLEMRLIVSGYAQLICRKNVELALAGDLLILTPGVSHALHRCAGLSSQAVYFTKDVYENLCAFIGEIPFRTGIPALGLYRVRLGGGASCECVGLMERLNAEQAERKPGWRGQMRATLAELLVNFVRSRGEAVERTAQATATKQAYAVIQYIESHYAQPVTALNIAEAAGASADHVAKRFRQMAGMTPLEYLRAYRMRHALALLQAEELSVHEVAVQVGVPDISAFSKQFKGLFGFSPRQAKGMRGGREQ